MTDTAVLTSVSVSSGFYTEDVLDIAKGFTEGCYQDYYFFQYNSTDFCLLIGDLDISDTGVSAAECQCYQVRRSPVTVQTTVNIPFSGSQNGQYGGSDGVGGYNGSVTGNSTYNRSVTSYNYYFDSYTAYNVSVQNPNDYLVYSSAENYPHLIEGVQMYAFAGFGLAIGVIAFGLIDRLFRRVY